MNFFREGLQPEQLNLLQQLAPVARKYGFYLAGGTALAIYLGHRVSVDFDWFTPNKIEDALALAQSIRNEKIDFMTEQTAPGTLHGTIMGIRVTFLEFQYPLLHPVTVWEEMKCDLASLDDLACMKLSAVAQRGARKDFCDIYALGMKHRSLQEMLSLYRQKFNIQDISPVLYGLSYFDDAESERMPLMLWDVSWQEMKRAISNWLKEVGNP